MNGRVALRISILISLIVLATYPFIHYDLYIFLRELNRQSCLLNLFSF